MISGVGKVVVPVEDQQRAKEFWVDRLGFELCRDESYGDERWIEIRPPGQDLVLALTRRAPQATHRELLERGVEFPAPPERQHFGWWALFTDPDGSRYALGQWD